MNQPPLILLVDDEADFLEIFYKKLRAAGFRVETAENGEKAIEEAKKLKPDLILMDMKMPKMNGAQAVMKLKENLETKDIGAIGYLRKTSDLDEVVQKVKTFFK